MRIQIREFQERDIREAIAIWNRIVTDGEAFPQLECLNEAEGLAFFQSQTYTGVAFDEESGEMAGLYILHPNNVGRCGHIANASYAVRADIRGRKIGAALVTHCLEQAKVHGYRLLQFNAVVAANHAAQHLYEKLGFVRLGVIPGGFLMKDGTYEDIILYYYQL